MAKPGTRMGIMGKGHIFCRVCGGDMDPERWTIKLEDLPPHVAHAEDPYLPRDPDVRSD